MAIFANVNNDIIAIFFSQWYRYIDISHPLKTAYFQFFTKYTVTHVPNDHAFITRRHGENYVRQKYTHFSIFGQDSSNGKVVHEKGTKVKYEISKVSISCMKNKISYRIEKYRKIKYRIAFDIFKNMDISRHPYEISPSSRRARCIREIFGICQY